MNKVIMHWICNQMPNSITLHALYTSIRFLSNKIQIEDEEFKIWQDGKSVFIIMGKEKIENKNNFFEFCGGTQKIKLISIKDFEIPLIKQSFVNLSGKFMYAYKYYDEVNSNKYTEVCPISLKGLIKVDNGKNKIKTSFINYLENNTGLNFKEYLSNTNSLRFERVFQDEKEINENTLNKKILFKNIIFIQAKLPVKDVNTIQKLYFSSIGKKRTYGFGSLTVSNDYEQNL